MRSYSVAIKTFLVLWKKLRLLFSKDALPWSNVTVMWQKIYFYFLFINQENIQNIINKNQNTPKQHIGIISEVSCDTEEEWTKMAKNSALPPQE